MKISLDGPLQVKPPYLNMCLRDCNALDMSKGAYTMAFRLCWTTDALVLPLGHAPRHLTSFVHVSAMVFEEEAARGCRSGSFGW